MSNYSINFDISSVEVCPGQTVVCISHKDAGLVGLRGQIQKIHGILNVVSICWMDYNRKEIFSVGRIEDEDIMVVE
jgi:hypothetical protein